MESPHAQDDFLRRADLVDQAGVLVHKDNSSRRRGVTFRVQYQFRHRRVEEDVQVRTILGLSVEAIETGTPTKSVVQSAQALLDSCRIAGVELVDHWDIDCFQCTHEANIGVRNVALVTELERSVAVSTGFICLECLVKAVDLGIFSILRLVEVSALNMPVSTCFLCKPDHQLLSVYLHELEEGNSVIATGREIMPHMYRAGELTRMQALGERRDGLTFLP